MAMSSVTSDLASLLSQYRVMAYHNMETGKDEGLVFVKKEEDQSTGELIRWTGEDNPPDPGTPFTASASTSPLVSSPCSRQVSGCTGTTPSTSQKQYSNPLNNNEDVSVDDNKDTVSNRSNNIIQEDSVGSRINAEKEDSVEGRLNVEEEEDSIVSRSNDKHEDSVCRSDDVKQNTSVRSRSKEVMKEKMNNRSYEEKKKRLELYKMAGEAGWVREVVKGDRKSHSEKMRITYLPPSHLRNIKNRLYNIVQLEVFLTTNCSDTSLTQDNFCFSAQVLGLDMPWEVVRQASMGRAVFPTKKLARGIFPIRKAGLSTKKTARPGPVNSPTKAAVPTTPCLHCLQPLPLSEGAAALHVRRCLHSKNARLRAVLEGADYSPVQHARPVQYKQRMPARESNQGHKMKTVSQPQARASLSLDTLPDCISVSKLSL